MNDIEKLKNTLKEIGVDYSIRKDGDYEYMFFGERRDIYSMNGGNFNNFHEGDLDLILLRHRFFEFENGELVSYPRS